MMGQGEVDAWFRGVLAGTRHYLYEEAPGTAAGYGGRGREPAPPM